MGQASKKITLDPTFPIRLRAARLKAGLSLEDLAQKLGGIVTRQAIAKYEKGLISPSPEVLEHLLQVLEIPPPPDIQEEVPERPEFKPDELEPRIFFSRTNKDWQGEREESKENEANLDIHEDKGCFDFLIEKFVEEERKKEKEKIEKILSPTQRAFRLQQAWSDLTAERELELRPEPRLPKKQVTALRVILSEKMKNYLWLEKLLRMEKAYKPPLSVSIKKFEDAEMAAEELRRRWDLGTGAVTNLLTFLEERGIKTFKLENPEKFESLSGFYRQQPFIVVEKSLPVDRTRFRTAAELAQILFGFSSEPQTIRLYNRFAAAFLLPAQILEEYFLPAGRKIAFSELTEIKLRYGVSLQAIMRRALDLELVTERRFRSFREMMNGKGWLWKEPVEYPNEENPSRFRRLLHYAVSSEILDLEQAAVLAETTPEELKKEMGEIF